MGSEENPAVKKSLSMLIKAAKKKGKYVGICGQGPSDSPELAKWLMQEGIDSVSLNPDSVIGTWLFLGKQQKGKGLLQKVKALVGASWLLPVLRLQDPFGRQP